jgi:2-methylisocitrate lyase-like PEP mutase family enzyme
VQVSGFGVAGSLLGKPDVGLVDMKDVLDITGHIVRAVGIPVMADIDTGGGNAINAAAITERLIEMGAAGVNIEDQVFPKRCGHMEGKQVIPAEEMAGKVRAMADARQRLGRDIVINARTDSYAVLGIEEAIRRANLYLDAGADLAFLDGIGTRADIERAVRGIHGLLSVNLMDAVTGVKTELIPIPELAAMGVARVSIPVASIMVMHKALKDFFEALRASATGILAGKRTGSQVSKSTPHLSACRNTARWNASTCRRRRTMGMTLAEKILARASGRERVWPDQIVVARVDLAMSHENADLVRKSFLEIGRGPRVGPVQRSSSSSTTAYPRNRRRPPPRTKPSANSWRRRASSISTTWGAAASATRCCRKTGTCWPAWCWWARIRTPPRTARLGPSPRASAPPKWPECGPRAALWFKVPSTLRIEVEGEFRPWVSAKDLILHIIGKLGADGADYRAVEFDGPAIRNA